MAAHLSNYAQYPNTCNRANEERSLALLVHAEHAMIKNARIPTPCRDTIVEVEQIINAYSPPRLPTTAIINSQPPFRFTVDNTRSPDLRPPTAQQNQDDESLETLKSINATLESIRRDMREGMRGVGAKLDMLVKQPQEEGQGWTAGCCAVS